MWGLVAGTACAAAVFFAVSFLPEINEKKKKNETEALKGKIPKDLLDKLQKLLGDRCVLDLGVREVHGKDQSFNAAMPPDAVVFPLSTQEVSEIVKLCAQHKVCIVPFGSGTSLEGHIQAKRGGITISFEKMNKVLKIHEEDMDCTVQPGLTYDDLNEKLSKLNLFFPLDPGPGASIGGMVGTSCSGTNAVRYGTMKENILNLTVVLPDGRIVKTANRAKKSSAGYDLTHLFVGSEGTLGVVTEATLRLHQIPEYKAIAVCEFPTIKDAANAAIKTIRGGIQIGKMELLDEVMMKAVNINSGKAYKETPSLFMEFSGTKVEVEEQKKAVAQIVVQYKGGKLQFATKPEEREELWLARKTALWAAPILSPGSEVKITDVCVPISRLAECISETKEDLKTSFLLAPIVGHVGDGNFHLFILVNPKDPKDLAEAHRIDARLVTRAISMEGTCTGEHGIGVGKRDYLVLELGENAVELMRLLKKSLDPNDIMNPGKVLPDAVPTKTL